MQFSEDTLRKLFAQALLLRRQGISSHFFVLKFVRSHVWARYTCPAPSADSGYGCYEKQGFQRLSFHHFFAGDVCGPKGDKSFYPCALRREDDPQHADEGKRLASLATRRSFPSRATLVGATWPSTTFGGDVAFSATAEALHFALAVTSQMPDYATGVASPLQRITSTSLLSFLGKRTSRRATWRRLVLGCISKVIFLF